MFGQAVISAWPRAIHGKDRDLRLAVAGRKVRPADFQVTCVGWAGLSQPIISV